MVITVGSDKKGLNNKIKEPLFMQIKLRRDLKFTAVRIIGYINIIDVYFEMASSFDGCLIFIKNIQPQYSYLLIVPSTQKPIIIA